MAATIATVENTQQKIFISGEWRKPRSGRYLPSFDPSKPAYALNRVAENFRHYLLAPITFSRDVPWINHAGWQPLVHTERAEDMSSLFLASPFLLLGFLSWKLFRSHDANLAPAKVFTAAAFGSGLIAFFSLLCFVGTSRDRKSVV